MHLKANGREGKQRKGIDGKGWEDKTETDIVAYSCPDMSNEIQRQRQKTRKGPRQVKKGP